MMKMNMNKIVIGFVVCALALPMMANAAIKKSGKRYSDGMVVTYRAGDLTTSEGLARVHRQIEIAATKVCGQPNVLMAGSFYRATKNQNCVDEAVENAKAALEGNVSFSQ
jgi:UrcA family protein